MGIDIKVESKIDNEWNIEQGELLNCKIAWKNINWSDIFKMIHFNIIFLYDNRPNYWSTEQLKDVLISLKKLKELGSTLHGLDKIIELFETYVDKKCRIYLI
jgi:hypothetical protein